MSQPNRCPVCRRPVKGSLAFDRTMYWSAPYSQECDCGTHAGYWRRATLGWLVGAPFLLGGDEAGLVAFFVSLLVLAVAVCAGRRPLLGVLVGVAAGIITVGLFNGMCLDVPPTARMPAGAAAALLVGWLVAVPQRGFPLWLLVTMP